MCSIQFCGAAVYTPGLDSDLSISSHIPNAREAAFYKSARAQTRHTAENPGASGSNTRIGQSAADATAVGWNFSPCT